MITSKSDKHIITWPGSKFECWNIDRISFYKTVVPQNPHTLRYVNYLILHLVKKHKTQTAITPIKISSNTLLNIQNEPYLFAEFNGNKKIDKWIYENDKYHLNFDKHSCYFLPEELDFLVKEIKSFNLLLGE